jgi:dUTP pyrophosphatase
MFKVPTMLAPVFRVAKIHPDAVIPIRATKGSAGYDLSSVEHTIVPARGRTLIDTGLAFEVPMDTYIRICPRSGLAVKQGIDVGAGIVDSDYRGPVKVLLFNHGDVDFEVRKSDRIAQMVIHNIETPKFCEITYEEMVPTDRGNNGFGSTGV